MAPAGCQPRSAHQLRAPWTSADPPHTPLPPELGDSAAVCKLTWRELLLGGKIQLHFGEPQMAPCSIEPSREVRSVPRPASWGGSSQEVRGPIRVGVGIPRRTLSLGCHPGPPCLAAWRVQEAGPQGPGWRWAQRWNVTVGEFEGDKAAGDQALPPWHLRQGLLGRGLQAESPQVTRRLRFSECLLWKPDL